MSKFTSELRWIIESGYDIGLKEYPIFDETYRASLNAKIIEHYYFREIGFETVALFVRFLNRQMNEIMPYFNQLYLSEKIKIEPIKGYAITETYTKTTDGTNTSTNESNASTGSTGTVKYSNTPEGLLNSGGIENNDYLTEATITDDTGTDKSTSNATGTSKNTETYSFDKSGSEYHNQSEMLNEYRKTFLNIDMQVINSLENLFMGVW